MNKTLYKLTLDTQKSIGALSELAYETGVQDGLIKANAFNALKPLGNADMRWIPCSERLPEHGGCFIATSIINEDCVRVGTKLYSLKEGWMSKEQTLAWMPLPEPYKESNDQ